MSSPAPAATATAATTPKNLKPIRVQMNFASLIVTQLILLASLVIKGLTDNPAFSNMPIDMAGFTANVASLQDYAVAAQDRARSVIALRNKYRQLVIQDLKQLAMYVENHCNDDPAVFVTTGFSAKAPRKNASELVEKPSFRWIDHGTNSGQIELKIKKVTGAKAYNLRYAVMNGTVPGAWTTMQIAVVNKPIVFSNLTPGTVYGFQVQALGTLGLTDFSTTETFMST